MKHLFLVIKTILALLLFVGSLSFEEASFERFATFVLIFILFVVWGFIRGNKNNEFLYLIDGFLIFLLEYYSKFVINYFFHSLYILILIEAGFYLKRNHIHKALIPLSIVSLFKFIYLLTYQINAQAISGAIFNLLIIVLVNILIYMFIIQKENGIQNKTLYQELLEVYKKEKRFHEISRQNAALKERHRIARDIHDSVGHQLTSLIMQLEMSQLTLKQEQAQEASKKLDEALKMSRTCLQETRKAVHALNQEEIKGLDAIRDLIDKFEHDSGSKIHLFIKEEVERSNLTPEESYVLYRLIQESMTNAIKHTKSKEIVIHIQLKNDSVLEFQIMNNLNQKNNEFKHGFGLKNMTSRIESILGEIEFYTEDDSFIVKGRFPLKNRGEMND